MKAIDLIKDYTTERKSRDRIKILTSASQKGAYIPISLINDFLHLPLPEAEKQALIKAGSNWNNLEFEDFYTQNIFNWDQNLASIALLEWVNRSDCLLWHRSIILANDQRITQRLGYTLLNLAYCGSGSKIIEVFAQKDDLALMSDAFISMILFRALQFDYFSPMLVNLAVSKLSEKLPNFHSGVQPISFYLTYLYRHDPDKVSNIVVSQSHQNLWTQINRSLLLGIDSDIQLQAFRTALKRKDTSKKIDAVISKWPPIWERHKLDMNDVLPALELMAKYDFKSKNDELWKYFGGIRNDILGQVIAAIDDEGMFIYCMKNLSELIDTRLLSIVSDRMKWFIGSSSDIEGLMKSIPRRISAFQNCSASGTSDLDRAFTEQEKTISSKIKEVSFQIEDFSTRNHANNIKTEGQKQFFRARSEDLKAGTKIDGNDFWAELTRAWIYPDVKSIDKLATFARQQPHLYQLCYIETLGKFKGIDQAALKLLDYIRSEESEILYAVIYALKGINTSRSTQELISCLTRPNIGSEMKFEVAQLLADSDLTLHQAELRNAIEELSNKETTNENIIAVIDSLTELVEFRAMGPDISKNIEATQHEDLDEILEEKIDAFIELSGEAKRALRTAQFFHSQLQFSGKLHSIDLSPAIDMQYKALELSFREKFEDVTGRLIRSGVLQRKLDLIGYARPSMQKMDEFERYIENLDIIKTIPFFSRFKLRKMLRGISLFRPGKRFTLDGLKAFALFFICFSRKKCPYGLANLLPADNFSDLDLANFCKSLHTFQDFRNRAAHEGFHPSASNDLDSIWLETGRIIETMLQLEAAFKSAHSQNTTVSQTG